jgi:hypothetical protein
MKPTVARPSSEGGRLRLVADEPEVLTSMAQLFRAALSAVCLLAVSRPKSRIPRRGGVLSWTAMGPCTSCRSSADLDLLNVVDEPARLPTGRPRAGRT